MEPRDFPIVHLPMHVHYDPKPNLFWVPVSQELADELSADWSTPVQIKIQHGQLVCRRTRSSEEQGARRS